MLRDILSLGSAIVACDLFLSLRLYHVPAWLRSEIRTAFPNVQLVPVNVPGGPISYPSADVYWGNRITAEIIRSTPSLRWIHFGSVGVDRAGIADVVERRIVVSNSKGLATSSMVGAALAFMTNLARGFHRCDTLRRERRLDRDSFDVYFDQIRELDGETCLIVGYGDVGQQLGRVCRVLNMNVTAIRRQGVEPRPELHAEFSLDSLDEAVTVADYVINLLPLTSETRTVFTRSVFSSMKPSAFFINIGRGETVDERAMIDALAKQRIAGAGLDVFASEPLAFDSPLWGLDNVMLTPHVAGLNCGYWRRQGDLFRHNLCCYLEGRTEMRNIVDIESLYGIK